MHRELKKKREGGAHFIKWNIKINMRIFSSVKIVEDDEQKTKYLQHFINKHDTIVSN
jgi:hypothetical protein